MIGNYRRQCSCVRYASNDVPLIVGLSVGLVLLLIAVIAVIVLSVVCRRDRDDSDSRPVSRENTAASVKPYDDDGSYSRRPPGYHRDTEIDDDEITQLPDEDYP